MRLTVKKPLIIITGPTAVGKTQLSLQIVESFNGEIISADSRLFYRGMDIGTAKPTICERSRIKHHLINISGIDQTLSLAVFQQNTYQIMDDLWLEKKVPFLVGGTGQFIRAIIEGWVVPPLDQDDMLRQLLTTWGEDIGPNLLHSKLEIIDPVAAEKIETGNLRRIVRALEVIFSTGELFSKQRRKMMRGFQYKAIGLIRDREELYKRIDVRIAEMLDSGLIDEVKKILEDGFSADLPALTAIGYKEVIDYLKGKIDLEEVERLMKKRTRSYVRRQANWFKQDDPRIKWFQMGPSIENEIIDFISSKDGWHEA